VAQAEQTNAQMQGELTSVTDKLKLTERPTGYGSNPGKGTRADYTKKLTEVQSTLATKASADDVKALGTDVNGVKPISIPPRAAFSNCAVSTAN